MTSVMNDNTCQLDRVIWDQFDEASLDEVDKIIKGLNFNKGASNDINAFLIEKIWVYDKNIILYMINNLLRLGFVPDKWKVSIVTPIQKVENTIMSSEFRPINTLPILEQILE